MVENNFKMQLKNMPHKLQILFRRKKRLLSQFIEGNRKLYNGLCNNCRAKAFKNPNMEMIDYCEDCQQLARDCLGTVKEKINREVKRIK